MPRSSKKFRWGVMSKNAGDGAVHLCLSRGAAVAGEATAPRPPEEEVRRKDYWAFFLKSLMAALIASSASTEQ